MRGRKKLYDGSIKCSCCGSDKIHAKGMCYKCYSAIWRMKKNPDCKIGKRGRNKTEKTEKVLKLLETAMTQTEIAKSVGVSRQAVNRIKKDFFKGE